MIEVILIIVFSFIVYGLVFINDYIKKIKELNRKCEHGIKGAYFDKSKCLKCKEKSDELYQAILNINESYKKNISIKKKQIYIEFLENSRLPSFLLEMDPFHFEELLCDLFTKMGFKVTKTSKIGDGGIDAILEKDSVITIMQAKRVNKSVGEPVFRDLYGVMQAINANKGLVVTTGKITTNAKNWIKGKNIEFLEINDIVDLLPKMSLKIS